MGSWSSAAARDEVERAEDLSTGPRRPTWFQISNVGSDAVLSKGDFSSGMANQDSHVEHEFLVEKLIEGVETTAAEVKDESSGRHAWTSGPWSSRLGAAWSGVGTHLHRLAEGFDQAVDGAVERLDRMHSGEQGRDPASVEEQPGATEARQAPSHSTESPEIGQLWGNFRSDLNRAGGFLTGTINRALDVLSRGDEDEEDINDRSGERETESSPNPGRQLADGAKVLLNDARTEGAKLIGTVSKTAMSFLTSPTGYVDSDEDDSSARIVSGLVAKRKVRETFAENTEVGTESATQYFESRFAEAGGSILCLKLERHSTASFADIAERMAHLSGDKKAAAAKVKSEVDERFGIESADADGDADATSGDCARETLREIGASVDSVISEALLRKSEQEQMEELTSRCAALIAKLVSNAAGALLTCATSDSASWESGVLDARAIRATVEREVSSISSRFVSAAEQLPHLDDAAKQNGIDDLYAVEAAANARIDQIVGYIVPMLRLRAISSL